MLEIFCALLWYLVGVASFIYWSRKQFDICVSDLSVLLILGFGGPFTFIIGFMMFAEIFQTDRILIKKKVKK